MDDVNPATSIEVSAEIDIAASLDEVWRSLTEGIGEWWDHRFRDDSVGVFLEPHLGGRFYEQFDDSGAGALYAIVTLLEPPKQLRISGPMGMPGARQYVKTYHLEPAGKGTKVSTTASMLGDLPDEMRTSYREGGLALLKALKTHVEKAAVRA